MKKRSELEIMISILEIARDEVLKTRIVYGSNLNFKIATRYIDRLSEMELIMKYRKEGKTYYKTTEKGLKFIRKYKEMF
ncbi:winged helix-turn-helix domain-containing protein [Geoglobus acetivorans]|uniref:ArnR1-like winged helix-turn-helix domain-containing protein n=1 Tax=Geoglobus acetivorans TaxID=565033 RepID=A0A0A7GI00_GEOAI|nr:hypothetical protein GACE_1519 [Geoglobus acetivorans]